MTSFRKDKGGSEGPREPRESRRKREKARWQSHREPEKARLREGRARGRVADEEKLGLRVGGERRLYRGHGVWEIRVSSLALSHSAKPSLDNEV